MSKGSLFPNFILRVGGYSFNIIERQSSSVLKEKTFELLNIYQKIQDTKSNLEKLIYRDIQLELDKSKRNKLLDLKRKINSLNPIVILSNSFINVNPGYQGIEILNQNLEQYYILRGDIEKIYNECEHTNRQEIIDFVKNNREFQNGLLLSSKSLYQNLRLYYNVNGNGIKKNEEQIENGVLRYFTRMTTKSTPFSTFCSILPGSFNNNSLYQTNRIFSNEPQAKKSEITLNKEIFGNIIDFIYKDKELRQFINVEINPTISILENNYRFLTSIDGKELFQRLQINPVLELIYNKLSNEGFTKVELLQLTDLVLQLEEVEATKDEAEAYLDKLLNIGFIRLTCEIPNQDAYWHKPLIRLLNRIEDQKADKLLKLILYLEKGLDTYSNVSIFKRGELLADIIDKINSCFKELDIQELKKANLPVYEDSTSLTNVLLPSDSFKAIENVLSKYILIVRKFAYPRAEQITMRHFYDFFYKDNHSVSLLNFYEDYYREHFKEHLQKVQKIQAGIKDDELKKYNSTNPYNLEFINKILNFNQKFGKLIISKWNAEPSAEEINITLEEIENLAKDTNDISADCFSISLFVQPIFNSNSNSIQVCIPYGKFLLGYGKYFSRFLYLFDNLYSKSVQQNNTAITENILAEICYDANFNANLHPPIVDCEIIYPTSEGGYSNNKISCTNILVRRDEQDPYSLELIHSITKKKIIPLDLGFLNPMMRPPLFQLLSKFTPPSNYSLNIPDLPKEYKPNNVPSEQGAKGDNLDSSEIKKETKKMVIVYRPRIVLENSIILCRKTWRIPASEFPAVKKDESKFNFFIRINNWRLENNIPDKVYIKVKPLPVQPVSQGIAKQPIINQDTGNSDNSNKNLTSKDDGNKTQKTQEKLPDNPVKDIAGDNNAVENKQGNKKQHTEQVENQKEVQKYSKDFFKPQFIDFYNPLLLNLFAKLTGNLKNFIVTIEERLPDYEQLARYDEKYFASELIMQFDFSKEIFSESNELIEEKENAGK